MLAIPISTFAVCGSCSKKLCRLVRKIVASTGKAPHARRSPQGISKYKTRSTAVTSRTGPLEHKRGRSRKLELQADSRTDTKAAVRSDPLDAAGFTCRAPAGNRLRQ